MSVNLCHFGLPAKNQPPGGNRRETHRGRDSVRKVGDRPLKAVKQHLRAMADNCKPG